MTAPALSNLEARRIFLDRHGLSAPAQGGAKGPELLCLIKQLGFVQLDSINTLARAHDLILYSRKPRYRPENLKTLYEKDRALFEHWTHDAAVIPMDYYRWWSLRQNRDVQTLKARWSEWRRAGFEAQFAPILDQIRREGPVSSSDVGRGEKRGSGGWWDWHPSKTALEYLWRTGALTVIRRDGFQKKYDLTERVLEQYDAPKPDDAETIDWCCNGALDRLGFGTPAEICAFWGHLTLPEVKTWCEASIQNGTLKIIDMICANGDRKPVLARPDICHDPAISRAPTQKLRVLSPFDPALRDRKRAVALFGFDYRIEVFVPAQKRRFGYYVFPILEGARLVGRVDMKAFRDRDTLEIRALWPENGVTWGKARQEAFHAEAWRLTKLAGVTQVVFEDGWLRDHQPI